MLDPTVMLETGWFIWILDKLLVFWLSVCWLFSWCFGLRFDREVDQHVPEYEAFEAPEARPCGSSGVLEIANKPPS